MSSLVVRVQLQEHTQFNQNFIFLVYLFSFCYKICHFVFKWVKHRISTHWNVEQNWKQWLFKEVSNRRLVLCSLKHSNRTDCNSIWCRYGAEITDFMSLFMSWYFLKYCWVRNNALQYEYIVRENHLMFVRQRTCNSTVNYRWEIWQILRACVTLGSGFTTAKAIHSIPQAQVR